MAYLWGFFARPVLLDPWIGMHVRLDERTAVLADGTRLRLTPPGQPTVSELVRPGDMVRGGCCKDLYFVEDILGPYTEDEYPPHYTLECTRVFPLPAYPRGRRYWLTHLVAQDGRLLPLFEANRDEVFVVGHRWPRRACQPSLFNREAA